MMRVSIFCPCTQTVVGIWILADHGFIVDGGQKCAETLETVADVAAQRYYDRRVRADQSWEATPDVRDC